MDGRTGWIGACINRVMHASLYQDVGRGAGMETKVCVCVCVWVYQSGVGRIMIVHACIRSLIAKRHNHLAATLPPRQRHARLFRSMAAAMLPAAAGANCQAHQLREFSDVWLALGFLRHQAVFGSASAHDPQCLEEVPPSLSPSLSLRSLLRLGFWWVFCIRGTVALFASRIMLQLVELWTPSWIFLLLRFGTAWC